MLKISNEEISNQQDFYAHHLGEIDKVNPVVSTEDIRTINNIPLVISGARITCKTAKRILEHKLLKPLEQQTQLNKTICGESLLKEFYALFQKYPDIKQTHEKTGYKLKFEKIVRSFILSPLVTQKLTVFHHCLPNEFEKTLFCTWLAVNISFSIKQDDHDVTVTYLAAITHDLGLLHISSQIFSKPQNPKTPKPRLNELNFISIFI